MNMPQLPEKTDKMDSIWQIVSLDGFHPPPAPTRDVATKGIIKFWRLFRKSEIKPDSPEKKKEELERISLPLLSKIVPAIDWNYGAEALDTHLNEWLNQCNQNSFIRLFIVPQIVEPTVANMVALLGASGLVLGFGLKDYFSSLIAGIVTLYEMPYRPGDWIEVDGAYGEVKQIGMRTVEIITPDDTTVSIPHLKMWDNLIFNANDGGTHLMCVADFYLNPHHDSDSVKQALYDVALTSPYVQPEKPIAVIVIEKPWGTHYRLKAYPIDLQKQFHFISDLTVRGKAALIRLGADFALVPAIQ